MQTAVIEECEVCGYSHRDTFYGDCRSDDEGLIEADLVPEVADPAFVDQYGEKWVSRRQISEAQGEV